MNISAVDMTEAIAGVSAIGQDPRPHLDTAQTRQQSAGDAAADRLDMRQIVEKMQEQLDSMNVSLQYSTYGDHGEKIAVAVVNKETGELIREIPSKELQALYAKMSELAGMIFNREI